MIDLCLIVHLANCYQVTIVIADYFVTLAVKFPLVVVKFPL